MPDEFTAKFSYRGEIKPKLMQFTMFDDSLQSFSNSKNDSSITFWHSSITDDLNSWMPLTYFIYLAKFLHSAFFTTTQETFMGCLESSYFFTPKTWLFLVVLLNFTAFYIILSISVLNLKSLASFTLNCCVWTQSLHFFQLQVFMDERLNEKCDAEFSTFQKKSRGRIFEMLVEHCRVGV